MPRLALTAQWSTPITVAAGDIVQNHEPELIEITPADPDSDPACLRLPPMVGAVSIDAARTIRARMVGRTKTGTLNIIRGL